MKKWISYGALAGILLGTGVLLMSAPDLLSRTIVGVMAVIICLAVVFGMVPVIQYSAAFERGIRNIRRAQNTNPSMPWTVIAKMERFFGHKGLDQLFEEYQKKSEVERKNGMIIGSIDETVNEDELSLRSWAGVMAQIPGTLTGLGLLGTFIGLITGISSVQISSVDATLSSIQGMFSGIQVAFYTSISGVILSIVFNIVYRILWNVMMRDYGVFLSEFQRNVIPAVEEQSRYVQKKDMQEIRERLSYLPKRAEFSLGGDGVSSGNESVLMPQILNGLQSGEFLFYLQPRYDLNSNEVIGAEALVRWKHSKLGLVSPSVFMPTLEKNGYIAKLDQYIWENVCIQIREWIDRGIHPVPVSVNISKTDIMALDAAQVFEGLLQKYRIPPRYLELDISLNAYVETGNAVAEFEREARQKGFRVVVDGFRGDFFGLQANETIPQADAYKLDLRYCGDERSISAATEQARTLHLSLLAEGIENMKQISDLRKNGISEGQGFFLSRAISVEQFEELMKWGGEE